jgi:hypothetical protein
MFQVDNDKVRIEAKEGHVWVREIDQNGCGGAIVSATLKPRAFKALVKTFEEIAQHQPEATFKDFWKIGNQVKGVYFIYRSH